MILLRARALAALAKPQPAYWINSRVKHVRSYATATIVSDVSELTQSTRNIGIIAHIDAGKTTTTERMLYYSGFTRRLGNVDDGSTVTDFLPAERARGITIQSAAVTFHWPPLPASGDHGGGMKTVAKGSPNPDSHTINLIDTPGHADFTFEVVRSLRILDGAVCILDGVAGVEAQTEKVWHQARIYNIPRIIYINKLDREGAAFGRTVKEVATKLHVYPAVCQLPWFEGGRGDFCGVVDVVNMWAMRWASGGDGKDVKVMKLDELRSMEPQLAEEALKARIALVELLSEHDDNMVDAFLTADENHIAVPATDIITSLRKMLLESHPVIPVLAGASFRNIGVQPVLDYITSLLPNPAEAPDPLFRAGVTSGGLRQLVKQELKLELSPSADGKKGPTKKAVTAQPAKIESCALAFKVVHDPKRGVLVYVRVYHGSLKKGATLYNTNLQTPEKAPRLFRMYANDPVDIDSIEVGQIGVITGLKQARTGDTLLSYTGMNPTSGPPAPLNELQLRPIDVPPPVFFVSVLPDSLAEQKPTEEALKILLREDPSLQVRTDEESGQMLLSGMGELHMEIARDRLINDMKAKCTVGEIEISFRECLGGSESTEETVLFEREIAGKQARARCTAILEPLSQDEFVDEGSHSTAVSQDGNEIIIEFSRPSSSSEGGENDAEHEDALASSGKLPLDPETIRSALHNGALGGLARGPKLSAPMCGVRATIRFSPIHDSFGSATTAGALTQASKLAVQTAIRAAASQHPTGLMEPVMNVLITATDETLGSVVHDLTSNRSGHVLSLDEGSGTGGTGVSGSADPAIYQQSQTGGMGAQASQAQPREEIARVDLKRVYAPPDPWDSGEVMGFEESAWRPGGNRPRTINARVPLREMVGYLKHLRSITKGRGTFVMSVDRFERMGTATERRVLSDLRGGF